MIYFVTGNCKKLEEVKAILSVDIPLDSRAVDLDEIQGSRWEIASHKCTQAAKLVNGPVITEDTSLGFTALNELPGPYIKWFLSDVGLEGLTRMLTGFNNKSATAYCTVAFFDPTFMKEPIVFEGKTTGQIVCPRGENAFGWDPIFQPDHESQMTYAEMPKELKNSISHRYKAFNLLEEYLSREYIKQ